MNSCTIIRMLSKDNLHGNVKENGFQQFRHWHSDIELVYVKIGRLTIEIDNNIVSLEQNHVVIIPGNVVHTFLRADENTVIHTFRVPPEDLYSLKHLQLQDVIQLYSRCKIVVSSNENFYRVFEDIMYADYGIYNQIYVLARMLELSVYLLNNIAEYKANLAVKIVEPSDITVKIQRFIENSLTGTIRLSMLADYLGFSETYCSRLIKQKTNMGFLEYVNQVRLRNAEEYLQKTNMSIIEICHSVGYTSIASFNRNFKKYRGVTPTEFRKGQG